MEKINLFIPKKIDKDSIFGKGFGKKEFKRTTFGTAIGVGIGFLIGIVLYKNPKDIMMTTVIGGFITTIFSYFLFVKLPINLSIYDYLILATTYLKSQKQYIYRRLSEWI